MASLAERDATEGAPSEAQNPAESSAMSDTSASASVEDRLKDAAEWKDKGNQLYLSKDYLGALEMYDTALKVCPGSSELVEVPADGSGGPASEDVAALEVGNLSLDQTLEEFHDATDGAVEAAAASAASDSASSDGSESQPPPVMVWRGADDGYGEVRAVYHCNRAACLQQLGRAEDAVSSCSTAVALHPKYTKAYMRRGQAYEAVERYGDAISDMDAVLKLEPTSKLAKERKVRCEKLEAERLEKLKTETMGKLKDLGNSLLGNFGLSTDNFKFEQDPNTGSYNVQFVQQP